MSCARLGTLLSISTKYALPHLVIRVASTLTDTGGHRLELLMKVSLPRRTRVSPNSQRDRQRVLPRIFAANAWDLTPKAGASAEEIGFPDTHRSPTTIRRIWKPDRSTRGYTTKENAKTVRSALRRRLFGYGYEREGDERILYVNGHGRGGSCCYNCTGVHHTDARGWREMTKSHTIHGPYSAYDIHSS